MNANAENNVEESSQSSRIGYTFNTVAVNSPSLNILPATCAFCQRMLSSENNSADFEAIGVCDDCKFLLLEDLETTSPDVYQRRMHASRRRRSRRRYGSSESIDSTFTQQFSHMITLARRTHFMEFEHDNQSVDVDSSVRPVQRSSARTTPSGSRRWRRVFSDTESDGFDSLYGESESNASFRRYRIIHGESDTMSYSAYGGDSDASVDAQSFLENENFVNPGGESDLESDTDIDPMNAGLFHWNSEDLEEGDDDDEDDSEWEEADVEGITVHSLRAQSNFHGSLRSNGSNVRVNSPRQIEGTFPHRIRETIITRSADLLTDFRDPEPRNYFGDSGDYLDSRGFENLLEHLAAETENPRRGAPPAAASFLSSMPCVTINEGYDRVDSLACAICKDCFTPGTFVNQLPCLHLYHPTCILPWLNARNTCPLCRYELPTDDADNEERKRAGSYGFEAHRGRQLNLSQDTSLDAVYENHHNGEQRALFDVDNVRENGSGEKPRNRWWFFAAPIVSMVGFSLMLWLGKPSADRRFTGNAIPTRRESSQRRWWSFF